MHQNKNVTEQPFMFMLDPYHYDSRPYHNDSRVPLFVLLVLWILFNLKYRELDIPLRAFRNLFILDKENHFCVDAWAPQLTRMSDCGIFLMKYIEAILSDPMPTKENISFFYSGTIENITEQSVYDHRQYIAAVLTEACSRV
jgi:hypothetical protein